MTITGDIRVSWPGVVIEGPHVTIEVKQKRFGLMLAWREYSVRGPGFSIKVPPFNAVEITVVSGAPAYNL